jgi:structural maintenance of chromosome 4
MYTHTLADFKNVSIVGHYIKERTKNAQFVIISLRNNMFELADRLVGIYKTDYATKTVAINPNEFVLPPPAHARTPGAGGTKGGEQEGHDEHMAPAPGLVAVS